MKTNLFMQFEEVSQKMKQNNAFYNNVNKPHLP